MLLDSEISRVRNTPLFFGPVKKTPLVGTAGQ
jgi:hypothetical protein